MVDISNLPLDVDNSNDKSNEVYCASLTRLSEIAGTFISQNNQPSDNKSNGLKYILQECINTLSNYRDECKKLKKLNLFNDPDSIMKLNKDERLRIYKIYESAYIYYKIIHIMVLVRIPNLPKFIEIKNYKDIQNNDQHKNKELIEIYNTIVNTLLEDKNVSNIKAFIKQHSNTEKSNSNIIQNNNEKKLNDILPKTGSIITAEQLQMILKNDNSSTLLIDVRPRLEFNNYHIKSKNILCIEPISFKESYSDQELEKKSLITSSNEEIELFQNRDKFNFIILYTDENTKSSFGIQRQSMLLHILLNKSFEKPLENIKVYILKNGISRWIDIGGEVRTLSDVQVKKKDNETDDSIYINGNTSGLSLQSFPKMVPSISGSNMDRSMQNMMSSSPTVMNGNYIIHEQQNSKHSKFHNDFKRSSSIKKLFSNFRNSSGSTSPYASANSSPGPPSLSIYSGPNPPLFSSTTSALSYSVPNFNIPDSSSIDYPEAPSLLSHDEGDGIGIGMTKMSDNDTNTIGGKRQGMYSKLRWPSRSSNFASPIDTQRIRSQTFSEDISAKPISLPRNAQASSLENNRYNYNSLPSKNNSDHIFNENALPDIPQLPVRPMSTSLTSMSSTRQMGLMSNGHNRVANNSSQYQKLNNLDFVIGLENMGNSCYMNCIIQCILGTHELAKIFLNDSYEKHINLNSKLGSKGVLAKNFARLVHSMFKHSNVGSDSGFSKKIKKIAVKPQQFKFACGSINPLFKDMSQQDCQEFSQFLLDGLHEDLNQCGGNPPLKELSKQAEELREKLSFRIASSIEWERYLTTDFSVIVDLFQGQYASRLQCKVCQHTSTMYQPFSVLSVPIPNKKNCNLLDCFIDFTKCENLETEEQWSCPNCKKKQPSTKQLTITRLPRNLIIHMKRFDNRLNKNNSFINYPFNLDLTQFWPDDFDGKLPPGVTDELPTRGQVAPFNYKLYGVACHFGSLYGGHYTAYVDKGTKNGWCYFDDTSVRPIKDHNEPISSNAYVLFYHRIYGV